MGDVKKPTDRVITILASDSEFEQFQDLERVGVMIGGPLGEALLDALRPYRDDVIERARS